MKLFPLAIGCFSCKTPFILTCCKSTHEPAFPTIHCWIHLESAKWRFVVWVIIVILQNIFFTSTTRRLSSYPELVLNLYIDIVIFQLYSTSSSTILWIHTLLLLLMLIRSVTINFTIVILDKTLHSRFISFLLSSILIMLN